MKRKFYSLAALLFFVQLTIAQHAPILPSSAGNSGTGANINVVYHRIDWTIDPRTATNIITGTVVTYFKTIATNVSTIAMDLNNTSFNNGSLLITYHGITCSKSFAGNIVTITLPATIVAVNTLDSMVINYSGVPPVVSGAAQGYQKGTGALGASPNQYTGSLSESYEDRDWWPCKADMQDKIDSMDINVTVPWIVNANADTFWVATNGVLYDSTITSNTRTFKYKTRYPIASYLVAVSVGKFNRYYSSVNINSTVVPVQFYILRNTASQPAVVTAMTKINAVVDSLSRRWGDYPFKKEKHGFYDGLNGAGGMEHQTFSAIANNALTDLATLTHELAHQWFGDNVSFATWNDLWLAEGPARFSEAYAAEQVPGLGFTATQVQTMKNTLKTNALGLSSQSAWIPNSSMGTSALIWSSNYGSTVYERGGMVITMLRTLCGDAKFKQAMTSYQTALAGKSATTDSLKNHFNAVLGVDIFEFFNDYVGGSGNGTIKGGIGNPILSVIWNTPVLNNLVLRMGTQTKTAGSNVTYFNGPVVVRATNGVKDTTIVFYDGGGLLSKAGNGITVGTADFLSYNLSFNPTSLIYDDSARTLSTGSTTKLTTLAVNVIDFNAKKSVTGNKIILSITNSEPVEKVILLKSANGIDFSDAGLMTKTNTSGTENNYLFNDGLPFSGTTFYRAKIYYAGKEEVTNIVKLQSTPIKGIGVSPNPANREVNINFENTAQQETKISVLSAVGKKVIESTTNNNFIHFDISNLSAGIYMVQVMQESKTVQTQKLLVHH